MRSRTTARFLPRVAPTWGAHETENASLLLLLLVSKVSDVPAPSDLTSSISPALEHAPIAGGSSLSNNANADSDSDSDADSDDYVYDVYYRDVLPSRPRPADVGLEPAAVAGHAGAEAAGLDANPELSADRVQVVGGAPVNSEGDWPAGWNAAAGGVGGVVAQLEGLSDSEEELVDSGEEDEFDEGEDEDSNGTCRVCFLSVFSSSAPSSSSPTNEEGGLMNVRDLHRSPLRRKLLQKRLPGRRRTR